MQFELGSTQIELYRATHDTKLLDSALTNLRRSSDAQRIQQIPIRAAEALTRIGEAYLLGGRFDEAQSAFSEAATRYIDASKRYPALAVAFNNRASVMQARATIATARAAYLRGDYALAAERYGDASRVLSESKSSLALIAIYDAWALLAQAQEHTWKAPTKVEAELQKAVRRFDEAEKALEIYDPTAESQRTLLTQGRRLSEALIQLDAARSLEREGRLSESSDKLADAARLFGTIASETDDDDARGTILAQANLCRACQKMLKAEQTMDPDSYNQAALLFQEVQRASASKQLALTAGGWTASCRALECGLLYRQSADKTRFEEVKKHLASAQGYFVDSGATAAAAWVTGMERMFDALAYLGEAESRLDQKERTSLHDRAEKSLQTAAQMFEKAGYVARQEETIRHLSSMIEQRQLDTSSYLISAPVIQSVSRLATQTLTQELPTGGETDSTLPIQGALNGPKEPLQVGQEYQAQLTILNTGERIAILERVENLGQPSLDIQSGQPEYRLVDGNLELNGKRLPSLAAQELPLRITPRQAGSFTLQPRILSVSTQGDLTIHPVPAFAIEVAGEPALSTVETNHAVTDRCPTGQPQVDTLLHGGIPLGYVVVLTAAASNEMRNLIRSFIRGGLNAGKQVLYLSRDPTLLSNVPNNALAKLSMISIGELLDGPGHAVSVKLTNLTEILLETTGLAQHLEGSDKRACVDMLSDILLQHGALNSRKWLSDLIRKLKSSSITTLAVLDPKLHEPKESQALLNLFDGEIEIS
jgi:tetratricopeptide (TPR) repeat protein